MVTHKYNAYIRTNTSRYNTNQILCYINFPEFISYTYSIFYVFLPSLHIRRRRIGGR
uniref:Uncharacterized protein n=1 Tax=Lepeophtheirus salmonis TaxID=72036 RepID=A0A0K2TAQ9_LEPSM